MAAAYSGMGRGRIHRYARKSPPERRSATRADGAILSPARSLKAFEELRLLLHGEDDEHTAQQVDLEKCFADFGSACWREHGSETVREPWRLDQLSLQASRHARRRTNSIPTFLGKKRRSLRRSQQYLEVGESCFGVALALLLSCLFESAYQSAGGRAESTTSSEALARLWKH